MSSVLTHIASFVGGAVVAKFGVDILSKEKAKKFYTVATAAGLRAKDSVMKTVTTVQENAADVLAEAKEINEELAARKEAEAKAEVIIDETEDETVETAETTGEGEEL